jgi:Uma2 family endonuclease
MTALPAPPKLLTVAEYAKLDLPNTELVRGKVVKVTLPVPFHGWVRTNVAGILRDFVRSNQLGRVMGNDSGIITERDPDTLRGADVAF